MTLLFCLCCSGEDSPPTKASTPDSKGNDEDCQCSCCRDSARFNEAVLTVSLSVWLFMLTVLYVVMIFVF